jgi:hypothetical protein
MGLSLVNLDKRTRQLMVEETELEMAQGTLCFSPHLTTVGRKLYPMVLRKAILSYDESWLAATLRGAGLVATVERRTLRDGSVTMTIGPNHSVTAFAEREFNRIYCCALCVRAIVDDIPYVQVFPAKQVERAGVESEEKIGQQIEPRSLLENLRTLRGIEPALGIPHELDSGLSLRLPDFNPEVG